MAMTITRISKADIPAIVSGEVEYMRYYNRLGTGGHVFSAAEMSSKAETLGRALDAEFARRDRVFKGFVAKIGGRFAGYALYAVGWDPYETECRIIHGLALLVSEEFRGGVVAGRLMQKLRAEGKRLGCREIHFVTSKNNVPAVKMYEKMGAVSAQSPNAIWLKFKL